MKNHYNLYCIFLEDKEKNPMSEEMYLRIRKSIQEVEKTKGKPYTDVENILELRVKTV